MNNIDIEVINGKRVLKTNMSFGDYLSKVEEEGKKKGAILI